MGRGSSGLSGGGKGGGGAKTTMPTAEDIKSFSPLLTDRGQFQIDAWPDGVATITGYIDKQNQIGYSQRGSGIWDAYDLVSRRSFASTPGAGSILLIINRAAANVDTLKRLRQ